MPTSRGRSALPTDLSVVPSLDRHQKSVVELARSLARRHGFVLHSLDVSGLAARDPEFAAVWRRGAGEAEAEEIFCRALEVDI